MLALTRALQAAWGARGPLACALWPLAWVHGLLWRLRRLLYRAGVFKAWRAPVPMVIVGNVVAGGAGKTPVTLALVEHLRQRGFTPGVVSRGHGRRTTDERAVLANSDPADVGDEPRLLAERTGAPMQVGQRRAEAVRALLAAHPEVDVVVCDDGLQHLALARDVEVLVTDERLAGNGWMLPAGPLREPWPRPADLWLHSGPVTPPGAVAVERWLGTHARCAGGRTCAISDLATGPVHAVAGIAHPERFFEALRHAGLTLARTHALPDHAAFDDAQQAQAWGTPLLCTEKDAAKLWKHRPDAWAVPLELQLPANAWTALDARLQALGAAPMARPLSSRHGHKTA